MKAIFLVTIILAIISLIPIVSTVETTTIPENASTTTILNMTTTTTTTLETTTTIPSSNETENITTTTTSTTVPATTTSTTLETITSTLPPKPEDKEPPVWSNLRHEPSVVRESESVNIIVGWYDNVGLETVIIFENSTGSLEEHIVYESSPGIVRSSVISSGLTGSFLIVGFIIPFSVVALKSMKERGISKIIIPFIGLAISIFFLSVLLFPEIPRNISRALARLGITPGLPLKTFSYTIPASELDAGEVVAYYSYANDTTGNGETTEIKSFTVQTVEVVPEEIEEEIETVSIKKGHEEAEIGKSVKWRKELVIVNPSPEEVKGYEVIGLPKDAKSIVVKDETGTILYRDKSSWETDIAGKEEIAYFIEYETPAPYKEETVIKPFVSGKTYKKRIKVKSDSTDHYQNVKAHTDIPEETSQENYKIKLYHIMGNSKIDVTNNPSYEVKFVDSDNNGLNDRIEWVIPRLSEEEFEVKASITIINVQSYPTVWGNWTVRFNTTGTADLTITPIDNTNFDVDIKFLELKCGDNVVDPVYDGKSVFYPSWSCSDEGRIINQVLKAGKHTLEFRFGDDVEYAYNQAGGYGFVWFDAPQDITPTPGSWQTIDLSPYVPSGTTGAIIAHMSASTRTDYSVGVRGVGDAAPICDATYCELEDRTWRFQLVRVSATQTIEGYTENALAKLFLMGYTVGDDPKFKNPIVELSSPGTGWQTIDVTDYVDADTDGICLLIEIRESSDNDIQVRAVGSTNDQTAREWEEYQVSMWCVKIDANDQFQIDLEDNTNIKFFIIAETKGSIQYEVNYVQIPDPTWNQWDDVDLDSYIVVQDGATGVFLRAVNEERVDSDCMLRNNSQTWNGQVDSVNVEIGDDQQNILGSPIDSDHIFERYLQDDGDATATRFFIEAITRYVEALPFNITLPGLDPIESSKTKPGTLSTPIEFNASDSTDYNVEPCVYGYGCAIGYKQNATTPIFNFTNTGSVTEDWNISLSEPLPSYIKLYGGPNLASTQEITTSGIIANGIPPGGLAYLWLWANFTDAPAGTVSGIFINHTSMQA